MSKKPYLKIYKEEFERVYKQRWNYKKIAAHFDISTDSVHVLRKRFELPNKRKSCYTVDENEFMRLYTEGVPIKVIAKKLKISRAHVYYVRKRLGLPYRNKAWEKKLDAKNNTRETLLS